MISINMYIYICIYVYTIIYICVSVCVYKCILHLLVVPGSQATSQLVYFGICRVPGLAAHTLQQHHVCLASAAAEEVAELGTGRPRKGT
jgi:hypothetical protein